MTFEIYKWPYESESSSENQIKSQNSRSSGNTHPSKYVPYPDLRHAVNSALALGMPLLLTGEPGTGKSELAKSVAYQLNLGTPYKFVAKSTSVSRDLFYVHDAIGRFAAAQLANHIEEERSRIRDPRNFIEYTALGKAILLAHAPKEVKHFLLPEFNSAPNISENSYLGAPTRSVVLIDEIDKAPRDFPNDLLDEIDNMQFRVPELDNIQTPELTDHKLKPFVVITSNSERQLPDPFIRRCVYFHIPFPQRRPIEMEELDNGAYIEDIVSERLGLDFDKTALVSTALELFYSLRDHRPQMKKMPATAELINWLNVLHKAGAKPDKDVRALGNMLNMTRGALIKNEGDISIWEKVIGKLNP